MVWRSSINATQTQRRDSYYIKITIATPSSRVYPLATLEMCLVQLRNWIYFYFLLIYI